MHFKRERLLFMAFLFNCCSPRLFLVRWFLPPIEIILARSDMFFAFKCFESIASINKMEYILHTIKNNICNVIHVLVFQQLLAHKHYKLRDS